MGHHKTVLARVGGTSINTKVKVGVGEEVVMFAMFSPAAAPSSPPPPNSQGQFFRGVEKASRTALPSVPDLGPWPPNNIQTAVGQ